MPPSLKPKKAAFEPGRLKRKVVAQRNGDGVPKKLPRVNDRMWCDQLENEVVPSRPKKAKPYNGDAIFHSKTDERKRHYDKRAALREAAKHFAERLCK